MHLVIAHVEPPLRFYCISGSVQKAEEPNHQQHRQCNSNKSFKYKAHKNKWKEHQCKHNFDDAPACSECKANHFSKNPKEKYNKKQRQHDSSPSFLKSKTIVICCLLMNLLYFCQNKDYMIISAKRCMLFRYL